MSNYFHAENPGASFVRSTMAVGKKPKQFFEQMSSDQSVYDSLILMTLLMFFPALEPIFFNDFSVMMYVFPAIIVGGVVIAWLWAEYVTWALRVFLRKRVSKSSVFHVVTYASTPNILHITVVLSPVVLLWQAYLMWRGFVSHLGVNTEVATWLLLMPFIFISFSSLGIVMFLGISGIIHFD